jgi:hypothetical protein
MRILLFFCFFLILHTNAQTFTNATATANNWTGTLTKTFTVSGVTSPLTAGATVLKQINLDFGDNATNYSWFRVTMTLTSPNGTVINIGTGSGTLSTQDFGQTGATRFLPKFRDHADLYTIGEMNALSGSSLNGAPYHLGFYRVKTIGSFANFNTGNPNGTWTLTITSSTTGSAARPQFNTASIVFGTAFMLNDVTASSTYDQCSGAQCLESDVICKADDNGFSDPGAAQDPGNIIGACQWNTQKNSTAWYKFKATATTADVSISGLSNMHQIIALQNTGTCAAPVYSVVAGGCPIPQITYTGNSGAGTYVFSGSNQNLGLSLSSLTIGQDYFLVIDGSGLSGAGAQSKYYIELNGGDVCASPLAINIKNFKVEVLAESNSVSWEMSENDQDTWYYVLERTIDFVNFQQVEQVFPIKSSSRYHIEDQQLLVNQSLYYYRLKRLNNSGEMEILDNLIVANRADHSAPPMLIKNEYGDLLFAAKQLEGAAINCVIVNLQGDKIKNITFEQCAQNQFTIAQPQVAGIYLIQLQVDNKVFSYKWIQN